jgi:hypothetical protein
MNSGDFSKGELLLLRQQSNWGHSNQPPICPLLELTSVAHGLQSFNVR